MMRDEPRRGSRTKEDTVSAAALFSKGIVEILKHAPSGFQSLSRSLEYDLPDPSFNRLFPIRIVSASFRREIEDGPPFVQRIAATGDDAPIVKSPQDTGESARMHLQNLRKLAGGDTGELPNNSNDQALWPRDPQG
jgi:hypothetical protein